MDINQPTDQPTIQLKHQQQQLLQQLPHNCNYNDDDCFALHFLAILFSLSLSLLFFPSHDVTTFDSICDCF